MSAATHSAFAHFDAVVSALEATGRLSPAATFEELEAVLAACGMELDALQDAPEALAEAA